MGEILTILGYLLIGIGLLSLYALTCVHLLKLCFVCIRDWDYVEGCVFAAFFIVLIGAGFGMLGSVI